MVRTFARVDRMFASGVGSSGGLDWAWRSPTDGTLGGLRCVVGSERVDGVCGGDLASAGVVSTAIRLASARWVRPACNGAVGALVAYVIWPYCQRAMGEELRDPVSRVPDAELPGAGVDDGWIALSPALARIV